MKELIDENILIDTALLKEWNGRWKFKFCIDGRWKSASSKQSAIEYASEAYIKTPKNMLLTKDERFIKHDLEFAEKMNERYGRYSVDEIRDFISGASVKSGECRQSSGREFNGNGGRRSGAAMSSEAARSFAEEKMKLERYLEYRLGKDA
ncbi:TPA: hypothetical protein ACLNPE_003495 [Vibrio cholerae O1]